MTSPEYLRTNLQPLSTTAQQSRRAHKFIPFIYSTTDDWVVLYPCLRQAADKRINLASGAAKQAEHGPGEMVDAPHTDAVVRTEPFPTTIGALWGNETYLGATRPASAATQQERP